MASLRAGALVLLLLPGLLFPSPGRADDGVQLVEQKIKAGLVYNFLKYTDWPSTSASGAPLLVCLFGGDPFEGSLQPMAGRTVNQHNIEIRTLRALTEIAPCAVLIVHAREKDAWPMLRTDLADKDVLTVSDFPGFAGSGGMIEFTRTDNRIGVKINTQAVMAAHLKVEDRLLRLANAVSPAP